MRFISVFLKQGVRGAIGPILKSGITLATLAFILTILGPAKAFALFGFFEAEKTPKESSPAIPPEYQGKQLPDGWLTNPKMLAAGKAIYEGTANAEVNCEECHGLDGKPTRKGRGAPDFSNPAETQEPNALWFWRISEGKPRTKMHGHKKELTEEERWQAIAYMRTFVGK